MSFREAKWLLEQIKSSLNNNSSGFQQVIKEQIELLNLPYEFYRGSAVVYNNEIHILGSSYSGNETNHYKYNGSSWIANSINAKQYLSPNDIYIKTYDGYSLDTFKNINSGSTIEQDSSDNNLYKVTLSNNTINIPEQAILTILR